MDTSKPIQLSLEQQFELRSFSDQAMRMSEDQAKDFLIKLYQQMLIREALYKNLMSHKWDITPPTL